MSIKTSLEGTIIAKILSNLAASEPKTTILGALLAGIVATKIDYSQLLQGDPTQIANAISAVVITVLGYYTNHSKLVGLKPPDPQA
jgi:hypothetical protein